MERVRGGVNAVFSLFIHSHTQKQVCAYVCIRKMQISGCETSMKTELLQNRLSSTFPCASFCYLVYLSRLFNIFYLILHCSHFLTKKHATRHKQVYSSRTADCPGRVAQIETRRICWLLPPREC